jgi:hypothetical protein
MPRGDGRCGGQQVRTHAIKAGDTSGARDSDGLQFCDVVLNGGRVAAGPSGDYQVVDLNRCRLSMNKKLDCRHVSPSL